jgi:hypothetical protein
MSFKMFFAAALALLPGTFAFAQDAKPPTTLTIVIDGTAGPVISGSDPLGLNGKSATVTVMASESLKPKKHSKTSATYSIPAGAVVITFDGTNYQTTSPSKMTVKLGAKADTLTFVSTLTEDGIEITITSVSTLAANSWTSAVLKHPGPFSPTPQNLSSPSSTIKYSAGIFGTTVLGVTGQASNTDAEDPVLPSEDD